jgi:hypothetical protein
MPITTITFYSWTELPQFSHECTSASQSCSSTSPDRTCCKWRQQPSPLAIPFDLTPCDFFLWGFIKDNVYMASLSTPIQELRDQITHALQAITATMLHRVWDEFEYRVDVCRVSQGRLRNVDSSRCWQCMLCPCRLRNKG